MKHIVIDARELRTSTGRYVERLLHYLQQIDQTHNYSVLLKPKDIDGWKPTNRNFKKIVCPYKEFTFSEQADLLRQIGGLRPDLVFFPMVQQPVFYRGNVVTTIQDLTTIRFRNPTKNWLVFKVKQQVYKWANKRVMRKSRFLIVPSKFVRDDASAYSGVAKSKFTVTYESADPLPRPAKPLPYLKNKNFIMYVGRPLPHKNLWRLIEAFKLLQPSYPDLKLVLVGKKDAMYDLIESRVKKAGIKGVVFAGFVPDETLRWLYGHCEVYAFTSLSEGFGLPALEAMLHGAPVASSGATCLPEVYGKAAHYFDPKDVKDIARAINDIIVDPQLRKSLVDRGKKQAAKYSWKRMAEQTLDVFRKALNE